MTAMKDKQYWCFDPSFLGFVLLMSNGGWWQGVGDQTNEVLKKSSNSFDDSGHVDVYV